MRILIDTNVLISAILFPNPRMNQLMDIIALEHILVLPSHVMEELEMLFEAKFKGKKSLLKRFFAKYSYEIITPRPPCLGLIEGHGTSDNSTFTASGRGRHFMMKNKRNRIMELTRPHYQN